MLNLLPNQGFLPSMSQAINLEGKVRMKVQPY